MKSTKRVLIYDSTPEFIENVSLAMQIEDEYPLDFAFITKNYADFAICVKNNKNSLDAILINAERLPMMPKDGDTYGLDLYFYTTDPDYDEIPEFGKYIGAYKIGEEQKFITDATRMINGWDLDKIPEREEKTTKKEKKEEIIKKEKQEKAEEAEIKEKIYSDEYMALQKQYAELKAMFEQMEKNKGAKVINAIHEEEEKEEEKDLKEDLSIKRKKTEIISIYSGKGGTGKTTIASQIAVSLAKTPLGRGFANVCLIDFDFELGDVSNLFNLPEYNNEPLDDFILTVDRKGKIDAEDLDRISFVPEGLGDISSQGSLRIIPAPRKFSDSRSIKPDTIDEAVRALADSAFFDYIICDTGNNLNKASLASLLSSDTIYVIYTPDFTTIKCNDSVIDALLDINEDLFTGRFKAIINRATRRSGLSAEKIEHSLKENLGIPVVGVIGPDEDVTYCNNYRIPIALDKDKNFYSELQSVIKDIVGEEYVLPDISKKEIIENRKEENKIGGFFKNIFKKKRK